MHDGVFILFALLFSLLVFALARWFHRRLARLAGNSPAARYQMLRGALLFYVVLLVVLVAVRLREYDHPVFLIPLLPVCFALVFGGVAVFQCLQARAQMRAHPEFGRSPAKTETAGFFWQGVFILLPVTALALASLISLRQDERAAESDARSRAAADCQNLAKAIRVSVDEDLRRLALLQDMWMMGLHSASQASTTMVFPDPKLQADIETWEHDYPDQRISAISLPHAIISEPGRQIEPPDFPAAPQPPKWFRELSPTQRGLWDALRAARSRAELESRCDTFRQSDPGLEAERAAAFLIRPPEEIAGDSGAFPSETGISYEEIACYRLLTATNAQLTATLMQELWWRVIDHPSVVSPKLLALAGQLTNRANAGLQQKYIWMQQLFVAQSRAGEYAGSLRELPDLHPWKTNWWSQWSRDGSALALFQPQTFSKPGSDSAGMPPAEHGYEVWLVPRVAVFAIFKHALAENRSLVPPYVTPELTIAGVRLDPTNEIVTPEMQPLIVEVQQRAGNYFAPDAIPFEVRFRLASRDQMLAAERRRAKIFGALIFGAALTALAGLFSAHRAFRRQLQLNEQKSNFVSSVSHELRAPIASVRLMAENLGRGKITEPARQGEYFRFIVQECRRLSSLIENVLDFSRIEQGRKQYEFEPTDLVALVETTVKLMRPYAEEKGVALKLETSNLQPPTSNLELLVDGRAIQQALVNLIDNAVKHSPKGETVTVGIESGAGVPPAQRALQRELSASLGAPLARAPSGTPVLLSIADHGPGIPAREHEKIFERFYRLGSELRRETQGVGIGLSVVKHIVAAHGGRVRVESEVGQGSRFTIELPT